MADAVEGLEAMTARIARAATGKSGFGKSILLDLGDAGAILIDGRGDETVVSNDRCAADTTVLLTAATLAKLMSGQLSAPAALAMGRIKLRGDVSAALKLASFL